MAGNRSPQHFRNLTVAGTPLNFSREACNWLVICRSNMPYIFFCMPVPDAEASLFRTGRATSRPICCSTRMPDALPRRLSAERDFAAVLDHFRAVGIPATWLEYLTPQDAFATFDNTHRWIAHPMRRNCVPIGDAAAESDPVWGNG